MPDRGSPRGRTLWLLLAATLACYGIGYPVALWGHSPVGWVLVFLGGPLLLTLGALTVRRIHGGAGADPSAAVEHRRK
jgi:hypothetical protein